MTKPLYIFIPVLLESTNNTKGGYWKKHELVKDGSEIVYKHLEKYSNHKFNKVHLTFQCFLGQTTDKKPNGRKVSNKQKRDCINNSSTFKMIEDCVVRSGMLIDDKPEFVTGITILSDHEDRTFHGFGTMIKIQEVDSYDESLVDSFDNLFRQDYKLEK